MQCFLEFVSYKEKLAVKHLKIIERLLKSEGFKTREFYTYTDPHLFVHNTEKDPAFAGIRIYVIADDIISYRCQNEEETEPYGKAYILEIEEMFEDLLEDHKSSEKAAKILIKEISNDLRRFFKESEKAEEILVTHPGNPADPMAKIVDRVGTGPDYGSLIYLPR